LKTRTDTNLVRHVLNGPTMGTRFAAVFYGPAAMDLAGLQLALQQAVDRVDAQMSTWKPESDLMQLNRAPLGQWAAVQGQLFAVLAEALAVGRLSGGAFDIGVGALVASWGFGPEAGKSGPVEAGRVPAHEAIELDHAGWRVRKHAPVNLDLSGIAKGFGVDELAGVLEAWGARRYLASIDGEVRAGQAKPDGSEWRVAIESPQEGHRQAGGTVLIADAALATSGDYRHVVERDGVRYAHTMDPWRRAPLDGGPAAVTVRAPTCMTADAWATALMVLGPDRGAALAGRYGLGALFAEREDPMTQPLPSL